MTHGGPWPHIYNFLIRGVKKTMVNRSWAGPELCARETPAGLSRRSFPSNLADPKAYAPSIPTGADSHRDLVSARGWPG